MRWSFPIGRVAGIDLRVHATFPLLLLWIAIAEWRAGASAAMVLASVGVVLAVFVVVVMHEYGHALTARRFGIGTRDITLLPIGGVARLERMPREPRQELLIALAGPAVNVVLAALLWIGLRATGGAVPWTLLTDVDAALDARLLLTQLLAINVWLAVFNLIPAFPMDGGRVLRALLAFRRDYAAATEAAARIGRAFALLFGFLGLFVVGNPVLVLIAAFVWLAAGAESSAVSQSAALSGLALRDLLVTELHVLAPWQPLGEAARLVVAGFQHDFPVLDEGRYLGMLSRSALVRGLTEHGAEGRIADVLDAGAPVVPLAAPIDEALAILAESRRGALAVYDRDRLAGLLTSENVMEVLMLRRAVGAHR